MGTLEEVSYGKTRYSYRGKKACVKAELGNLAGKGSKPSCNGECIMRSNERCTGIVGER